MSVSVFNRCWSKVILETLVRQGVSHFCIAPGSRSTPLTLEAVRFTKMPLEQLVIVTLMNVA